METKAVRILIVEHDEGDAFLFEEFLTELRDPSAGWVTFEPMRVERFADGIELLRKEHFDALILDLAVADAQGLTGVEIVLEEYAALPLIVVTDEGMADLGAEAVERGAQEHIVKSELAAGRIPRVVLQSIQRQRLRNELRERTIVDELTGLYNRRGFFALGDQEMKLIKRREKGFVVVFADLDDLKRINDRYGHEWGDRMLRETADFLRSTFRDSDIVSRIGGDEFAVVAHESGKESAELIARRVMRELQRRNEGLPEEERLSMSIGVVHYDGRRSLELDELLARADRRMYEQKRARKRVHHSRRVVSRGGRN